MEYCADTWFILELFEKNPRAISLLQSIKFGKDNLIIPIVVYGESIKKLMQKGIPEIDINQFFLGVESSNKVKLLLIEKEIAREAAKISLSYNLPLMDSFVAAACKLSKCDFLLSGDEDHLPLRKNKYLKIHSW